jgi:hypothetical protein
MENEGYIYLLQEREFINSNKNIYKIGKSKQTNLKRFKQYPKGSKLLFQIFCNDCDTFEKDLILLFIKNYKQITSVGVEYFEGDCHSMNSDIFNIIYNNNFYRKQLDILKQNSIYKCEVCFKILSSKRNLEEHEQNVCKYSNKCPKCFKILSSKLFLEKHEAICIGLLKCNKCDKILSRKQNYLIHISKCK